MENMTVYDDTKTITKIYHIADIHIHNKDRYDEYKEVFDRLFEIIGNDKENSIVVICGDILHDGQSLLSEVIYLLKYFCIKLARLTDVLLIPGNHDIDKKSTKDSEDPLHVILNDPPIPNLRYIKQQGLYKFGNLIFGHTTMVSDTVQACPNIGDHIKVGIYHGSLQNSRLGNGITLTDCKFGVKAFKDYDMVLLGDIHKYQYINSKKTIAYSGSLIQQDHMEDLLDHGVLKWTITGKNINSELIRIPNKYGRLSLKVTDQGIDYDPDIIPEFGTIILTHTDLPYKTVNKFYRQFRKKYPNTYTRLIKNTKENMRVSIMNKDIEFTKINNEKSVIESIIDYLKRNKICDEGLFPEMREILNKLLKELKPTYTDKFKSIKLLRLEFSNILKYDENNTIDFIKFNGIMGLNAKNFIGKSSIIDIILYSIYGKSQRATRDVLINKEKDEMRTVIELEVDKHIYKITRTYNKITKIAKVSLVINGKDKPFDKITGTESYIKKHICPLEDFLFLNIITQDNPDNFVKLTDGEKFEKIYKLFNLDIFRDLQKYITKILKDTNKEIEILNQQIDKTKYFSSDDDIPTTYKTNQDKFTTKLSKAQTTIKRYQTDKERYIKQSASDNFELNQLTPLTCKIDIKITKQNLEICNKKIASHTKLNATTYPDNYLTTINTQISQLVQQKIPLNQNHSNINISKLQKELLTHKTKLSNIANQITEQQTTQLSLKSQLKQNTKPDNLDENYKIYMDSINIKNSLQDEINSLTKSIKSSNTKLTKLQNHKFNTNCEACMCNPLTQEILTTTSRIQSNTDLLNSKNLDLSNILSTISQYSNYSDLHNLYYDTELTNNTILSQLNNLEKELELLNTNKELLLNKIQNCEQQILDSTTYKNNIEFNNNLEQELNKCKLETQKYTDWISTEQNIKQLQLEQTQLLNNIADYDQHSKTKLKIKTLKTNIKTTNSKFDTIVNKITDQESTIDEIKSSITKLNTEYDSCSEISTKLKTLFHSHLLYTNILKAIDKEGFCSDLLQHKIIPGLETHINSLFNNFCDFTIKFDYDPSYKSGSISVHKLEHDNDSISSTVMSGYELMITNIVFRIAFSKIIDSSKSNFFIVDEAFHCCDASNREKLSNLFDFIKSHFKWMLTISHDDSIKRLYDTHLRISSNNGFSHFVQ